LAQSRRDFRKLVFYGCEPSFNLKYLHLLLLQESVVVSKNANWRLTVCALHGNYCGILLAFQTQFLQLEGTVLALGAFCRSEPEHRNLQMSADSGQLT
jgi:hypothetical protein